MFLWSTSVYQLLMWKDAFFQQLKAFYTFTIHKFSRLTIFLELKHPVDIALTALFAGQFIVLSPSSCAVPQQPERPDCELHGDWTGATGGRGGGAHLLSSGEGDAAEVHDPDEAPSRGRTGTGNLIFRYRSRPVSYFYLESQNTDTGQTAQRKSHLLSALSPFLYMTKQLFVVQIKWVRFFYFFEQNSTGFKS